MIDQRRYARVPIHTRLSFFAKGREAEGTREGVARDISLGGMFVETEHPAPFSAEVVVRIHLPNSATAFDLPGVVRWVRSDGMGVQFGLLGVHETRAITELGKGAQES